MSDFKEQIEAFRRLCVEYGEARVRLESATTAGLSDYQTLAEQRAENLWQKLLLAERAFTTPRASVSW